MVSRAMKSRFNNTESFGEASKTSRSTTMTGLKLSLTLQQVVVVKYVDHNTHPWIHDRDSLKDRNEFAE